MSDSNGQGRFQGICSDRRSIVAGPLRDITAQGCELIGPGESAAPTFPRKATVTLNLVDEQTGRSMNVKARLTGVTRKDGAWAYRLRWDAMPEVLQAA